MDALARISLIYNNPEQPDPFALLERISLTRISVDSVQEEHPVHLGVASAWRFLVRATKSVGRSIRSLFVFDDTKSFIFSDHDLAWTSLSRVEQNDVPDEFDKLSLSTHEHPKLEAGDSSPSDPRFM